MDSTIDIHVTPEYLAEHSSKGRYTFAYHISIHNRGDSPVQLMSRHWVITDGNQEIQEVRGSGVVGEQPVIHPGTTFSYSSGTSLATAVGSMHGSYQMQDHHGQPFDVNIAAFTLAVPGSLN